MGTGGALLSGGGQVAASRLVGDPSGMQPSKQLAVTGDDRISDDSDEDSQASDRNLEEDEPRNDVLAATSRRGAFDAANDEDGEGAPGGGTRTGAGAAALNKVAEHQRRKPSRHAASHHGSTGQENHMKAKSIKDTWNCVLLEVKLLRDYFVDEAVVPKQKATASDPSFLNL